MTTASPATRVLGAVAVAGLAVLAVMALVVSPDDVVLGDSVRLMYVHVPTAWLAYLAFAVTALGSGLYLWKRTRSLAWDRLAGASAEIGVVFTGLCLLTGMLWGKLTWGVYWDWDARMTTTALLFVLFLGYLAIRRLPADAGTRARRSAVAGLVAFVDVPIVHQSVKWWRTLHQDPTVLRPDPTIDGLMLFTLFLGVVVFTVVYAWLLVHRARVAWLEDRLDEEGLDVAIAERHAEALTEVAP